MFSVFIDPVAHPQQPQVLVAYPIQPYPTHPLDQRILDALKAAAEPVGTWELFKLNCKASRATTRAETRSIRQQALTRINPLLKCGLIKRIGRGALALP